MDVWLDPGRNAVMKPGVKLGLGLELGHAVVKTVLSAAPADSEPVTSLLADAGSETVA